MSDERVAALEDMVTALSQELMALRQEMDSLTGGISGAIDKRKRGDFKAGFEGKYPDLARFGPALDKIKLKDDYMGKASDALYDYSQSGEYSEEGEKEMIHEMVNELEEKLGEFARMLEEMEHANEPAKMEPTPAAPEALPPADEAPVDGEALPAPVREAARSLRGKPL